MDQWQLHGVEKQVHYSKIDYTGVDAVTLTNGVRVEWLNSFTYFANRSIYAYDGDRDLLDKDKQI